MQLKKIVIISPFQFRLQRGIERFTYSLANEFCNHGIKIIIYTWSKKKAEWGQWNENVTFRTLPFFKYFENKWAALFYTIWLGIDKPNQILLNFLYHGESNLPKKLSYHYVLHSPASQVPHRYKFMQSHESHFKNLKYIAVSKMVLKEALPYLKKDIEHIYIGADLKLFKPIENKTRSRKIKFISTAAFEERKGIQFFIEFLAVDENPNFEYHIYGTGSYKATIIELIDTHNLHEQVFIHEPANTIETILPHYDIYILLSKGESFGLGWLEAAACGLPVIVSNEDPFPELVGDNFGCKVNPLKISEIDAAVHHVLANYHTMSDSARAHSLKFNWSDVANRYIKLLSNEA